MVKKLKKLTLDEIAQLPWGPGEKFALVNMETKSLLYTSDVKDWLVKTLERMTTKHPVYHKLQLVENPKNNG
jgi:hypothetical protein